MIQSTSTQSYSAALCVCFVFSMLHGGEHQISPETAKAHANLMNALKEAHDISFLLTDNQLVELLKKNTVVAQQLQSLAKETVTHPPAVKRYMAQGAGILWAITCTIMPGVALFNSSAKRDELSIGLAGAFSGAAFTTTAYLVCDFCNNGPKKRALECAEENKARLAQIISPVNAQNH